MKLRVTIELDNAAFEPGPGQEVARILRGLADWSEDQGLLAGESIKLLDINGNHVGKVEVART